MCEQFNRFKWNNVVVIAKRKVVCVFARIPNADFDLSAASPQDHCHWSEEKKRVGREIWSVTTFRTNWFYRSKNSVLYNQTVRNAACVFCLCWRWNISAHNKSSWPWAVFAYGSSKKSFQHSVKQMEEVSLQNVEFYSCMYLFWWCMLTCFTLSYTH